MAEQVKTPTTAVELRIVPGIPETDETRGGKHIGVMLDRLIASDGEHEIDLSPILRRWDVFNQAGRVRMVHLVLFVTDMGDVVARHPAEAEKTAAELEAAPEPDDEVDVTAAGNDVRSYGS